jgi:hypothetical protein
MAKVTTARTGKQMIDDIRDDASFTSRPIPEDRVMFKLMGVDIGTATGWDQLDSFAIMIYSLEPNETAIKMCPALKFDWTMPNNRVDLGVDWERGVMALYDNEGNETLLDTDWSVFNKKGGPGWQASTGKGG